MYIGWKRVLRIFTLMAFALTCVNAEATTYCVITLMGKVCESSCPTGFNESSESQVDSIDQCEGKISAGYYFKSCMDNKCNTYDQSNCYYFGSSETTRSSCNISVDNRKEKCPIGYYCPGGVVTRGTYDAAGSQPGLDNCPKGWLSDEGATAKTSCYYDGTVEECYYLRYDNTSNEYKKVGCDQGHYCPGETSGKFYFSESADSTIGLYACPTRPTQTILGAGKVTVSNYQHYMLKSIEECAVSATPYHCSTRTVAKAEKSGDVWTYDHYELEKGTVQVAGAGYYVISDTSCMPCPKNSYNTEDKNTDCVACASGTGTDSTASTQCKKCVSDENVISIGTWSIKRNSSNALVVEGDGCTAKKCANGEKGTGAYSSVGTATGATCVYNGTCAGGYYNAVVLKSDGNAKERRTIQCTVCPKNKVCYENQNRTKEEYLDTCETATKTSYYKYSAQGAKSAGDCYLTTTAGNYVGSENADQTECPAGYYCAGGTKVNYGKTGGATACPAGTYRSSTGATQETDCTKCPAGTYSTTEGATTAKTCIECPVGTYSTTEGASTAKTCIECPAGKYNPLTGQAKSTACKACPKGTYNATKGQEKCTFCAAGKTTDNTESKEESSCKDCLSTEKKSYVKEWATYDWEKDSKFGVVDSLCMVKTCQSFSDTNFKKNGIASATITLSSDKKSCTHSVTCSPGWHTPTPTASENYKEHPSCTGCAAGYYCTGNDGKEKPCDKDTYSETTQSSCSNCSDKTEKKYPKSDGTTGTKGNETTLADSKEKCYVELVPGKYVKVKGEKTGLVDCPAGYYCPGCKEADFEVTGVAGWKNYIDKDADNTKCKINTKMYYNQTTGGDFKCPAGTYRNATNGEKPSNCKKCKAGATSLAGSTSHKGCFLSNETNFCDKAGCFTLPFFWDGESKGLEIKQNKE
ncbi:MAG: hypothetical protein MJ187_02940 [Alphaproteobacteria bacterium]|nr:hypothetical protein [Alphaproteobacteria bacterium]